MSQYFVSLNPLLFILFYHRQTCGRRRAQAVNDVISSHSIINNWFVFSLLPQPTFPLINTTSDTDIDGKLPIHCFKPYIILVHCPFTLNQFLAFRFFEKLTIRTNVLLKLYNQQQTVNLLQEEWINSHLEPCFVTIKILVYK